jgi:hypothetical protein
MKDHGVSWSLLANCDSDISNVSIDDGISISSGTSTNVIEVSAAAASKKKVLPVSSPSNKTPAMAASAAKKKVPSVSSLSKEKQKVSLVGHWARQWWNEKKKAVEKESKANAEYLEAKLETIEKMTADKEVEPKNVSKMSNLEYCFKYLQKLMQLSNSGMPHEVLLAVLRPPDGI